MKDKTPKIIAVDFDGTLCTNAYPEIGEPIPYSLLYDPLFIIICYAREGGGSYYHIAHLPTRQTP